MSEDQDGVLFKRIQKQRRRDVFFRGLTFAAALFSILLLAGILVTLIIESLPTIKTFGFHFLTSSEWDPNTSHFGALVPIYGTLVTSLIALFIATPVSFGVAVFLTEISPNFLKKPLGTAIELLAAIPSIIYGMWGLFVFAPFFSNSVEPFLTHYLGPIPLFGELFQGPPMGMGIFTAGFILSMMIVPFISAIMRDVFNLVPSLLKEAGYGMGATKWEVIWTVVVPEAKKGVIAGIVLGLGRALGETMAVTFVIGNSHEFSTSLFMPGNTISSALANEFTEATGGLYTSALVELGLILFVISTLVLALARVFLNWQRYGKAVA